MEYTHETFLWQQTYVTLFAVSNKLQVCGDNVLEHLTMRQLMTLIAIVHLPKGETSLNRIAEKMGTTKQNVKQLVSAMVKKSFVRIVPSKMDKRACNVEISEKGMAVFEECNSRGIKFLSELFYNFSENELENLWQMLKKLYCFDGKEQSGFEETAVEELFNIQIPANILNKYRKE